jgi:hypothetical protein
VKVRAVNENTLPEQLAQQLAELTAEVTELSRRVQFIEADQTGTHAQQTDQTILSYDGDENSIQFLTENGFVIVRPWETNSAAASSEGKFTFRVEDPEGIEREVSVCISDRLLTETALRTRGRIESANRFWTYCAERRLANYLMENGDLPPENEMRIDGLDGEDVLLTHRWERTA